MLTKLLTVLAIAFSLSTPVSAAATAALSRERLLVNNNWRFMKGDPLANAVDLSYDRLKSWILPTGNSFIIEAGRRFPVPDSPFPDTIPYTEASFDDSAWRLLDLPHDWGIEGPFSDAGSGATGRLPFYGVGWYRKKLSIPVSDNAKSIFLDVDGAMSYATVWLNGRLVGGWPYGYASWRVNLTPYVKPGGVNQLAIRLDNPPNSSRWYPGGGIYRSVRLVKTSPVHVGQWGTYLTTPEVSNSSAGVHIKVTVDNDSAREATVQVSTQIFPLDQNGSRASLPVASIAPQKVQIPPHGSAVASGIGRVFTPRLWGPYPHQRPNRYVAVTILHSESRTIDRYETVFGIRSLKFDPDKGFFINGTHVKLNGVCDHHDLGALGTAVNYRALQRQLEMLVEMGANAIRTSHNPPAPQLLELADRMGLLVMDETFDVWLRGKTPNDYSRLFADWHEQDTRMLVRRDRNHPSVIMWSIGNEVGEQGQGAAGAAVAKNLSDIVHQEDPTRPTTSAMNNARAGSPFPETIDTAGLNYQGAGTRGASPQYPVFHENYPKKFVFGSETASTISSRGEYIFPVAEGTGAVAGPNSGENVTEHQMSSYDLYFPPWASSPDKEFAAQEEYAFVAGEFVWTGWDYLGEPTPFNSSRSSYFGIIDLAGFKKDRFYLYQAHWRPNIPMVHILPHWTWPERVGLEDENGNAVATPVHVYTSGDEAELFLNGKSLGRKKKGKYQYRIRWDDVIYEPGELKVIAYKEGKRWATAAVQTAGDPARLSLKPDRAIIKNDGLDLSFVTLRVADSACRLAPRAKNQIHFSITGPGEIVATDNGDPTDFTVFSSPDRKAFNGLALVIVRSKHGRAGKIILTATSEGLPDASTLITVR
jgi:beta-galactosidase